MKNVEYSEDRLIGIYRSAHGAVPVILIYLTTFFVALTLGGCDMREVDAAAGVKTKKEENMESLQTTTTLQNNIPPIDAAASSTIETATFAMG